VIFTCEGFKQKGKENHNIIIHAFRSKPAKPAKPAKPQFKALTAIKPEATKPETQNILALCAQLKVLAILYATGGTRNTSER
jgi:hypothetical protein